MGDSLDKIVTQSKIKEYVKRYGVAEVFGTVAALTSYYLADTSFDNEVISAYAGTIGENVGFYGTMLFNEIRNDRNQAKSSDQKYGLSGLAKSVGKLGVEFGASEIADSLFIRPLSMGFFSRVLPDLAGVTVGKIVADLAFYAPAIVARETTKKYLS